MFRSLYRRLQLISYYSASKPRTVWFRALGRALFASLLLGPFVMLATEPLSKREQAVKEVAGAIVELEEGSFLAVVIRDENQRAPWASGIPYGEFKLQREATTSGFPFVTRIAVHAPTVNLRRFSDGVERQNVSLAGEPAVREAIELALAEAGEGSMLVAWRGGEEGVSRRLWVNSVVSGAVWWVLLSLLSWISITTARIGWVVVQDRQEKRVWRRASAGLCATCGYNLKGLEFHARCPECGALVE